MNAINHQIGKKIYLLRQQNGLLQKDLAKNTGLPERTIGRIERGEVDARISTLARIALALNVPLKELVA